MKKILATILMLGALALPYFSVTASGFEAAKNSLQSAGNEAYGDTAESSLPTVVGTVVNSFLAVMGIVLTIIIIRGGFMYMTAGGESGQTEKAKKWIINGIVGLIIVLLAYALSTFVIDRLIEATTNSVPKAAK